MTKRIAIEQLKPGMVIIKVTQQNGPVKIKKSGVVNSDDMVKALAEMGVQEIEIDPDMTVDLKPPKITKSKTQQLLEDTSGHHHVIDQGLSEQFNRSLFLPSVQELPEAWQYYGRKTLVVVLVILGGLSIGWVLANLGERVNWKNTESTIVQTPKIVEQQTVAPNNTPPETPPQATNVASSSEPQIEELDEAEVRRRLAEFEKEKLAQLEAQRKQKREEDALVAQQLESQKAEQEQRSDIPPELLKRFQAAMESIGDSQPADPVVDVEPIKDVPTVAELPAWALTQLPSLAFSAHMYVSAPEERWVRVNGKRISEGQEIEDGLVVVGIEPQHVIMSFRGQEFSMDALSDW
ncbi:general secretion pathway protein GspB [Aliiglaciecola litoralis]|uniref:General secretion pathway protein B n=1 Tax=Aliiglaciecola litoralis TaxID=582857 RepID=A0ABN1LGR0_9ALTE